MAEISIRTPVGSSVTAEQVEAIRTGCLKTIDRLGSLGECVALFLVTFSPVHNAPNQSGPNFKIVFADPFGNECSHSTDYRFIGKDGDVTRGSPTPSADAIADALAAKNMLPRFIRQHLARGAATLASINAAFKRLGKEHGYLLQCREKENGDYYFSANSKEEALKHVAEYLGIRGPMTLRAFNEARGMAVYANYTQQVFPPRAT